MLMRQPVLQVGGHNDLVLLSVLYSKPDLFAGFFIYILYFLYSFNLSVMSTPLFISYFDGS